MPTTWLTCSAAAARKRQADDKLAQLSLTRGVVPFVRQGVNRKVNINYSVYAFYNNLAGTQFYTFNSSNVQSLATIYTNTYADLLVNTEFTTLIGQYNVYRIKGVAIKASTSFLSSVNLLDAPPVFLDMGIFASTSTLTSLAAARSDNAMEVKINNLGDETQVLYYSMPPLVSGVSGTPMMGSSVWIGTTAGSSSGSFYLTLGSLASPSFSTLAINYIQRVLNVEVIYDVDFAAPTFTS